MRVNYCGAWIELVEGDIADQEIDAIVNAAHPDLLGGQGVDGVIQRRGGYELRAACVRAGGCPIGDAIVTPGGGLPAPFVIHAVGPTYEGGDRGEPALLESAYRRCVALARERGLGSVAFPALSTGAFCYPMPAAAEIAMRVVLDELRQPFSLTLVRFVLYPRERPDAYAIHCQALAGALAAKHGPERAGWPWPKGGDEGGQNADTR